MRDRLSDIEPSGISERISVIVPTLNEVHNVDALLTAILAPTTANLDLEILVADGGSTDGTVERVRAWEVIAPVRLIECGGDRGLAGDVLDAAQHAASVVVVMDGDLSHPAACIPELVAPIIAGASDMVVGSRYVPGGSTPHWPLARRLLSRLGAILAWPLCDVRDPMSGFFAVRRDCLLAVDPRAAGFKIGLEVMAAGGKDLRVSEVPITFTDRTRGTSKINLLQMAMFVRRLMILAGGEVSTGSAARFAIVGLMGLVVDFTAFMTLLAAGSSISAAHVASFVLASIFNYALNARWSFSTSSRAPGQFDWWQYARFLTVCVMALFLRGGVLAMAINGWGWSPKTAILLAIASGTIVNYLGSAFFVFPAASHHVSRGTQWRIAAIGILGYVILMHLIFSGTLDLMPEEAYYWDYSQHLDIGYLDHPPMVVWLIWLGTKVGGDTEFAVRIGAILCWFMAAFFTFQLTRNLYGKTPAFIALMLFCILPFFFVTGLVMTPDAPLTAAWSGGLYFLERALIGERRNAWLGVGLCVGLGMLSKYTIALLAPATLLFLTLDPSSRRWLWRPQPYVAVVLAGLFFSPVIYWNILNEWSSFAFQGARRLEASFDFSLHILLASILLLLTPVGFAIAIRALWRGDRFEGAGRWRADRRTSFIVIYTLLPLSIFITFSLFHEVKLNWTGPLWLGVVPALARSLAAAENSAPLKRGIIGPAWRVTVLAALLIYGAALNDMVLGVPDFGLTNMALTTLPVAWREFGEQADTLEAQLESATDSEPLLVGMDRYFLSSEMAFYDSDKDGAENTAGRSLFGMHSLMFRFWFKPAEVSGRNIILFSLRSKGAIAANSLSAQFKALGPIQDHLVFKDGNKVGNFFYRIGYGYRAN